MEGYNIAFKIDGRTIAGRTQDDLNIAAIIKESLTKDDKGNSRKKVTGHNVTFRAAGLMDNTKIEEGADGTPVPLTRDEIIAMSLKTGDDAIVPVRYGADGGLIYGGDAIISGYTESTNAQGDATIGLDFQISGDFKPVDA